MDEFEYEYEFEFEFEFEVEARRALGGLRQARCIDSARWPAANEDRFHGEQNNELRHTHKHFERKP